MFQYRPSIIEALESRELFAAVHLAQHILVVNGQPGASNTIMVGLTPDNLSVAASITFATPKGPKIVSGTFPLSQKIKQITIRGGARADIITIDQTNGSFNIYTRIITGAGDDVVNAGDEQDYITNTTGNDYLNGGAGNDIIHGGNKNDTLVGGPGNDRLISGRGHNWLEGDGGNDTLFAVQGHDTLYGGDGADTFSIRKNLNNHPTNDYTPGIDILYKVPVASDGSTIVDDILHSIFWPF